jgi:hypothetical protein
MSLIFGEFPSLEKAKEFARAVLAQYGEWRKPAIFTDLDCAMLYNIHPFTYGLPAVHVDRDYDTFADEKEIIALAETFGGTFIGT